MKTEIEFTVTCMARRRKWMNDILRNQTGLIILRFRVEEEKLFGKFTVWVEDTYKAYQLGMIIGRAQAYKEIQAQ